MQLVSYTVDSSNSLLIPLPVKPQLGALSPPSSEAVDLAPSVNAGIGMGPPGEFSSPAVKTSTPVSVTRKVCSVHTHISVAPGIQNIFSYVPN